MRTLLFPQISSYLLSDGTPTRKAHCLLCGITQIPNISLRNTKTRNHTVQSSSFHLAEDESEITSEWGLPSRQCKRLAPAQEGHSLLSATAGHLWNLFPVHQIIQASFPVLGQLAHSTLTHNHICGLSSVGYLNLHPPGESWSWTHNNLSPSQDRPRM